LRRFREEPSVALREERSATRVFVVHGGGMKQLTSLSLLLALGSSACNWSPSTAMPRPDVQDAGPADAGLDAGDAGLDAGDAGLDAGDARLDAGDAGLDASFVDAGDAGLDGGQADGGVSCWTTDEPGTPASFDPQPGPTALEVTADDTGVVHAVSVVSDRLLYAHRDPGTHAWSVETISATDTGAFTADSGSLDILVVGSSIHVFFQNPDTGDVTLFSRVAGTWTPTQVDLGPGYTGGIVGAAAGPDGTLHIAYPMERDFRYATRAAGATEFRIETLDSSPHETPSIFALPDGSVTVLGLAEDLTTSDVYERDRTTGMWTKSSVDSYQLAFGAYGMMADGTIRGLDFEGHLVSRAPGGTWETGATPVNGAIDAKVRADGNLDLLLVAPARVAVFDGLVLSSVESVPPMASSPHRLVPLPRGIGVAFASGEFGFATCER
jgi:hypothetical protein